MTGVARFNVAKLFRPYEGFIRITATEVFREIAKRPCTPFAVPFPRRNTAGLSKASLDISEVVRSTQLLSETLAFFVFRDLLLFLPSEA